LNKTTTSFGARLLRKWVACPLFDIKEINDRYDAIEDLQ
jgi:DNA mismatch repair ATPase MutS